MSLIEKGREFALKYDSLCSTSVIKKGTGSLMGLKTLNWPTGCVFIEKGREPALKSIGELIRRQTRNLLTNKLMFRKPYVMS